MVTLPLPVRTLEVPKQNSYPQFRAEDSVFYSRWIYGNNAARMITWLRNSQLFKAAYTPKGQVQNQGYRVLYGISLTAITVIGLCLDTIQNFLAVCSLYYLGKKIWEYKNSQGAFSPTDPSMPTINTASNEAPTVQVQTEALKTSPKIEEFQFMQRWLPPLRITGYDGPCDGPADFDEERLKNDIRNEQKALLDVLRNPRYSQDVKKAFYTYLEIAPMKELRRFLPDTLSDGYFEEGPLVPIGAIRWILALRDALSDIPLPEDPLEKLHSEIAAEWTQREAEFLADLANSEDTAQRSNYEDVKKRYQFVLKELSDLDYWRRNVSVTSVGGFIPSEYEVLNALKKEIKEFWKQKEAQFLSNPALSGDLIKRAAFEAEKEKFRAILEPSSVRENPSPVVEVISSVNDIDSLPSLSDTE